MTRYLKDFKKVKALAEKLEKLQSVSKLDTQNEKEAWTLAHSFADIEESIQKINKDLFPRLISSDESEINDILLEIGEEYRHLLYHINDPKFFKYLSDK